MKNVFMGNFWETQRSGPCGRSRRARSLREKQKKHAAHQASAGDLVAERLLGLATSVGNYKADHEATADEVAYGKR